MTKKSNDADSLRWIVVHEAEEGSQGRPVVAGDEVTIYELAEPFPYADLPAHVGHTQELLDYQQAVLECANRDEDWRVESILRCHCRSGRTVAQVLVHEPTARRWVTAKPERLPAALRNAQSGAVDGWPLHGRPGEAPHVGGVSSCKGCDQQWLVVSFIDRAEIVRVLRSSHRVPVAP